MDDILKTPQGVTSAPVVVKIFSNEGYNLNLIDMPGLTKIAL